MTIEIFLDGAIPKGTHQEKKVTIIGGKPRFYEPANLKAAREYYMARLKQYAPKEPFEGAVSLSTTWIYKPPKTRLKAKWKTTAPDTDNLVKLLKDCMTKCGFWKDDAQVVEENIVKIYSDGKNPEGLHIACQELDKNASKAV